MSTPSFHQGARAGLLRARPLVAPLPIAFALAFALACASGTTTRLSPVADQAATPQLDAVPDWALANPSRRPGAEIGIGSGRSLDEATRYALQDVAARLSVSVESELRDTLSQDSAGTTVERLEQVIETRVTGARFAGWERTRSAERAGTFWAEVRIDRARLARDARAELEGLRSDVELQLESAGEAPLRRLLALQSTQASRERIGDLVSLVGVLEDDFDRDAWAARRRRWRTAEESARRALIFEIRTDALSSDLVNQVESRLVSARLRTRAGRCTSPDAVCIDITSELTETAVASRHIAKVRSTFAVVEPGGTVFAERDLVGKGDSKSDRDRAKERAFDALRNAIAAGALLGEVVMPQTSAMGR